MKIAVVCYPTYGGSGVVATELGIVLAKKGHEIHFVTYSQPVRLDMLNENIRFHEVEVQEYPLFHYQPYELALSSKLVGVIKKHKIDVLHVHYAIPHAYAGHMAQQMLVQQGIHIPMVTTLHGTDITLVGNNPHYKPAVTFSINQSNAVTSVSKSLKDDTLRLFDIEENKIEVVPNFIDISKGQASPECRRHIMALPEEKIITHISNFRPVKRIEDVILIFEKILNKIPAKLIMVGDGPLQNTARMLCKKLGIYDKVIFMGNSNEIDKILCFSDLFLLPSERESFGLAALEAMIHGVPVISSNSGGIPEVNKHGFSGFLSEVGNIEEMADNGISILKSEETLRNYKKNAKIQATNFDVSAIVPIYEKIYERVIQNIPFLN